MVFGYQPPAAMSMMGQGVAEGIGKVGQIYGQGLASMGESIGKGITAAAGMYAQGKEAEGNVKSMEKMAKTITDDKIREPLLAYLQDTNISTSQKSKFGMDFFNEAIKNQYLMNLEKEKEKSRMELLRGKQSLVPSAEGIPMPTFGPNPTATSSYMPEINGGPVQRIAAYSIPD